MMLATSIVKAMRKAQTPKAKESAKYQWIPRKGPNGVFCSPSCGFGCKQVAYDRVVREGKNLAEHMGPGWKMKVWDNLGWHYKVRNGVVDLHPKRQGDCREGTYSIYGYQVFFNSDKQFIGDGDTPELALADALKKVKNSVDRITQDMRRFTGRS
jgi:hypothetical protein